MLQTGYFGIIRMIAVLHAAILSVPVFRIKFLDIYSGEVSILELLRREIKPPRTDILLDLSSQVRVMIQVVVWFGKRER